MGENPTRQSLRPEAIGAVMEVTKWLKPSISVSRIGDSASVQAATRVNVEQAFGRAQIFKAPGGLLQLGIEAADAQPDQRCFHSVDNPSLLSDQTLTLAVGPLGIFVLDCGDHDHLAVVTFATQPSQKDAFEQLGVETIGLRTSMLA